MELLGTRRRGIQDVDAAVLQRWLDQGEAVLVDVREPGEHAAERIEGSVPAPLTAFDPRAVLPVQDGRRLVLYCRSGNRSSQAGRRLLAVFAGATGTCGMAMLLARMPWNRTAASPAAACPRERP